MHTKESALALLNAAGVFFDIDETDPEEAQRFKQMLNLNDVWGWATADSEYVPDESLPEVATLFFRYGWAGILYWVSTKRGGERSEFYDVNRHIDFVAHEERLRQSCATSSEFAYKKASYTIS